MVSAKQFLMFKVKGLVLLQLVITVVEAVGIEGIGEVRRIGIEL
jgi:hypothetical protein